MAIMKPFYITYQDNLGMTQVLGSDTMNLRSQLETYGSGLDSSGLRGGPLLTPLAEGVVLCWIRGVPHYRGNVWEAWGVVAHSMDDLRYWPSHWEALKSEPSEESINIFSQRLEDGWGNSLPPESDNLASLLSSIHRENVSESRATKFKIDVSRQEDIGTLAWLWLLGPIPWKSASVAPPRRNAVSSKIEPSYEGRIVDAPRPKENIETSYLIEELLALARRGDLVLTGEKIEYFRQQNLEARRSALGVINTTPTLERGTVRILPPPKVKENMRRRLITKISAVIHKPEDAENGSEETQSESQVAAPVAAFTPQERRLKVMESKINALLLAALLFFVVDAFKASSFFQKREETKEADEEISGTQPIQVESPPPPTPPSDAETGGGITLDQRTLADMHRALAQRLQLTPSSALVNSSLANIDDEERRMLLASAATQIILSQEGCAPATSPIDGKIGGTTARRIKFCQSQEAQRIAGDPNEALRWLYAWLRLTPTLQGQTRP